MSCSMSWFCFCSSIPRVPAIRMWSGALIAGKGLGFSPRELFFTVSPLSFRCLQGKDWEHGGNQVSHGNQGRREFGADGWWVDCYSQHEFK
jgi:hypothetical protein